jgi:hypothetical protein
MSPFEKLRAELHKDYIAFDDTKPFGVYIYNEDGEEKDFKDFATKQDAEQFVNSYNASNEEYIQEAYNSLDKRYFKELPIERIYQDIADKLAITTEQVKNAIEKN